MNTYDFFNDNIRALSGVPIKYRHDFLHSIERRNDEQRQFIECIRDLFDKKVWSVFVLGTVGNGKTTIASAAVNTWNSNYFFADDPAYYKTQADLTMEYKQTFSSGNTSTEFDVFNKYARRARFLVIDELNPSEWTETNKNLIQKILVERYANRRRTLLIGNLRVSDIEMMFDPHIRSRLREGRTMYMTATDMRKKAL